MSGKYFIVSQLNGLVLDVIGNVTDAGTEVLPWEKNGGDNQIWYDDPATGTIRSSLTDFCLSIRESDKRLIVNPYQSGNANQQWERVDGLIRNRVDPNTVIDIWGSKTEPGSKTGTWQMNGGDNQLWTFEAA